jgi:hypothetical protein
LRNTNGALEPLRQRTAFTGHLAKLKARDWVVYAKAPFAGPEKVLDYVGRYTHRVAISNNRLLDIENDQIRFKKRLMTVTVEEFLRRFLLHTLPRGFVRIRFCGFLANRHRRELLPLCRQVLNARPLPSSSTPPSSESKHSCNWLCPLCGGTMTVIEKLTAQQIRRRSVERVSCADTS